MFSTIAEIILWLYPLIDTGIQIWNAVEVNNMTLPPPEVCREICPPDAEYVWECSIGNPEVEITYDEYKVQNDLKLKCLQGTRNLK